MDGNRNKGQGPIHGALGTDNLTDPNGLQGWNPTDGLHLEYDHPHAKGKQRLQDHRDCVITLEECIRGLFIEILGQISTTMKYFMDSGREGEQ